MRPMLLAVCGASLILMAVVRSQGGDEDGLSKVALDPKQNPTGITVRLVAKEARYRVPQDLVIDDDKEQYSPAPAVDLVLEITNAGKEELHLKVDGDDAHLLLDLQGPGAVSKEVQKTQTQEDRLRQPVAVAPGKTYALPIKRLGYGSRNEANACYWTRPGNYTLAAGLATQVGWKKDHEDAIVLRRAILASEPIKLVVIAAAAK